LLLYPSPRNLFDKRAPQAKGQGYARLSTQRSWTVAENGDRLYCW